jgi:hypothetical protein
VAGRSSEGAAVLPRIERLVMEHQTYGYHRITAALNSELTQIEQN